MDVEDAVRLRRVVHRLARAFNAAATAEGVTPTEASVLGLLVTHELPSLGALAQLEHINPTMLSRVVGRLEQRGLVERTAAPTDLRSVLVRITDAGRDLHRRVLVRRADTVAAAAATLTPSEYAALLAGLAPLEKLVKSVR